MARFLDNFNPFRGDVLYGTTAARTEYVELFLESGERQRLEAQEQKQFSVYHWGYMINDYNDAISKGDFSEPTAPQLRYNNQAIRQYMSRLNYSKYAPDGENTTTTLANYAKGNINLQVPNAQMTEGQRSDMARLLAVRRACKFGIQYISSILTTGATVHYALDHIQMPEVVGKEPMALYTGTVGVPITTSELRYLFRNWGTYSQNPRLQFYRRYVTVPAPWEEDPKLWLLYAEDRVHKYRDQLQTSNPAELTAFEAAIRQNRDGDALRSFHQMTIS